MKGIIKDIELTGGMEIIRRYFVMNGFDGVLTTFGILLAAFISGEMEVNSLIWAVTGGAIAMAVSGFWGAYTVELSERKREMKKIEKKLFKKLENTRIGRAMFVTSIVAGFVDGFSPFLFSMLNITPLFISILGVIRYELALRISIVLSVVLLFMLGSFLGKISRENIILFGAKMMLAAVFVMVFVKFFGIIA